MNSYLIASILCPALFVSGLLAQEQAPPAKKHHMQGTDMQNDTQGADTHAAQDEATAPVMHSMEGRHMDMGPHMKMTALREPKPGDAERAQRVVEAARKVAQEYADYLVALNDGFEIFLPNVPQKQYHFTNYRYAFATSFQFNPEHPTSLLYEKHGDGYKLIGVMYTAPKDFSEDELDARIPLSIAQWHAHVNLCIAPKDRRGEMLQPHSQFGLNGSISTQEACTAAGGIFRPQVFGWMVHVYPFESNPKDVWSVEKQVQ